MQIAEIIATKAAATTNSNAIDLGDCINYSISVNFTGADVVGATKLQARNTTDENWVDITEAYDITASADYVYSVSGAGYRFVRLVYTHTSGTGNITANYMIKEVSVRR